MSRIITRRSMLVSVAAGLPAVAVGSSLVGGSRLALGAPGKVGKAYGPAGPAALAGGQPIRDDLRPLAEQVLHKARHVFTVAAADPKRSFASSGITATAARFVKAQPAARITRSKGRALARLDSGDSQWRAAFGGYTKVKTSEYEATPSPGQGYGSIAEEFARSIAKKHMKQDEKTKREKKIKREKKVKREKGNPEDYDAKPLYKRIEFHLNSVKCVVDTNEVDSDEIRIGGHLIRPDGEVTKISSHMVYDNFDPGKQRNYDNSGCIGMSSAARKLAEQVGACNGNTSNPWAGRVLASAPLTGPWPGTFGMILLMCEEDHGGMNELLTELYARIKDQLSQGIADLGKATGELVEEYLGEEIGAIVNEIVVWVLSELVAWIVSLFDNVDDPIAGKSWVVTLPNRTREDIDAMLTGGVDSPSGTQASAIRKLTFTGDAGKYEARMHWRALA